MPISLRAKRSLELKIKSRFQTFECFSQKHTLLLSVYTCAFRIYQYRFVANQCGHIGRCFLFCANAGENSSTFVCVRTIIERSSRAQLPGEAPAPLRARSRTDAAGLFRCCSGTVQATTSIEYSKIIETGPTGCRRTITSHPAAASELQKG